MAYQLARRRGAISRITEKQRCLSCYLRFGSSLPVLAVDLKGFGNVIQQFSATEIISMLDGIDTRLDEMRKKVDEATATATAEATAAEESAEQDRLVREEEALAKEKGEFAGVQSSSGTPRCEPSTSRSRKWRPPWRLPISMPKLGDSSLASGNG